MVTYSDPGVLQGAKKSLGLLPKKKTYDSTPLTNLFAGLKSGLKTDYGLAQLQLKQSQADINKGYGDAAKNATFAASGERRAVLNAQDMGLASQATATQNAGLANTTAGINAQRSVYSQGSGALAGVDQQLATILSNLEVGRGGAQADVLSQMGDLLQSKQAAGSQIGILLAEALRRGWTGSANALSGKGYMSLKKGFKKDFHNSGNPQSGGSFGATSGLGPFFSE